MIKKAHEMEKRFPQGHWTRDDYIIFVQQLTHSQGIPRGQSLFCIDKNYADGLTAREISIKL